MTLLHILEIFGTLVLGSIVGGIGTYVAASFKFAGRFLVLEKRFSDFQAATDRRLKEQDDRLQRTEDKVIWSDVCDNCKEVWIAKIDAYHAEAQQAILTVKEATSRDMKVLNENNTATVKLLGDLMATVTHIDNRLGTMKVVR